MATSTGSALYDSAEHEVDIYLMAAPTRDDGGGVVLNWSATPDQEAVACIINKTGSGYRMIQGKMTEVIYYRVSIKTALLEITLTPGFKMITSAGDQDPGRTLIVKGYDSPNRSYGHTIPQLTYIDAEEIRY